MKKEDILEASKRENKKKDPYVFEVQSKASKIAYVGVMILTSIYFSTEIIRGDGLDPALYSIFMLSNALLYGYEAVKLEKNRIINAVASIVTGLCTMLFILEYFKVI